MAELLPDTLADEFSDKRHEVIEDFKGKNKFPNAAEDELHSWTFLLFCLLDRDFGTFAYLLELGADLNQVMYDEEHPDDCMTFLDYIAAERFCCTSEGEQLVLDGFEVLALSRGAKSFEELKRISAEQVAAPDR